MFNRVLNTPLRLFVMHTNLWVNAQSSHISTQFMSKKNRNLKKNRSSLFHIKPSVKVKVKIVKLLMYVDRKKRTGNKPKLTSYFCLLLIGFAKDVQSLVSLIKKHQRNVQESCSSAVIVKLRSSHRRCSIKKIVLKNFSKFTGKHVPVSPF